MENLESLVLEIPKRRLDLTGFTHQKMNKVPYLLPLCLCFGSAESPFYLETCAETIDLFLLTVDVFADASPMVISVLDGYNVCIFAYGQTGTGKTFTMEGTEDNRGVNYRTLEELFNIAKERKETIRYDISVSVLEVYNEQIRDLLATSPSSKK